MTRARLAVCAAIAAAALAGVPALLLAAPSRPAVAAGGEILPDLDVTYPYRLVTQAVTVDGRQRFLLAFASEAMNVGEGPLIVRGSRSSLSEETMAATQVIMLADGGETLREDVGHLEFVEDETHRHWHLLPFMRYELRRATSFQLVVPDQKTGFCLGDRVLAFPNKPLPGQPERPVYNTNCGADETDLLGLVEGISVGWADVYEPWRDGQYLDITGLAGGRYVLVHRVNPGKVLAESKYANNAASALLSITWPNGKQALPRVRVLKHCPHTARCHLKR